jgi:hypothetical protein
MNETHQKLIRSLIAAQVAAIEHADEAIDSGESSTKVALFKCLDEARRLAKQLDD